MGWIELGRGFPEDPYHPRTPDAPASKPGQTSFSAEMIASKKSEANKRRRLRIYKRCKGKCAYCGIPLSLFQHQGGEYMTLDHVLPRSKGGKTSDENLVPACVSCNNRKDSNDTHVMIGNTLFARTA